jgi:hypothetical protein
MAWLVKCLGWIIEWRSVLWHYGCRLVGSRLHNDLLLLLDRRWWNQRDFFNLLLLLLLLLQSGLMFLHLLDVLLVSCINDFSRLILKLDGLFLCFNCHWLPFVWAQVCYLLEQYLASFTSSLCRGAIVHQFILSLLVQMINMIMRYLLTNYWWKRFFVIISRVAPQMWCTCLF